MNPKDEELFDRYAVAALTGLLANSEISKSASIASYLSSATPISRAIIDAAMGYAISALRQRSETLDEIEKHIAKIKGGHAPECRCADCYERKGLSWPDKPSPSPS